MLLSVIGIQCTYRSMGHKHNSARVCFTQALSIGFRGDWGTFVQKIVKSRLLFYSQTCDKIPKRSEILDLQDPGPWRILDLLFSFSHGILEILDPVTATLKGDPRDLGSQTRKILLDTGDPGSSLSRFSWDLADIGSYPTMMPLYFERPYIQ